MGAILLSHSDSHPLRVDVFREAVSGHRVDAIKVEAGGMNSESETLKQAIVDADALYIRTGRVTEDVLAAASHLKIIATAGSGFDHIDLETATEYGVMVTHAPEGPGPGVVEHTFGLLFSLTHELPDLFRMTSEGGWSDARRELTELTGASFGVIGLGTIGFEVASIASQGFEANVTAYDPYVSGERSSEIYPKVSRSEVEAAGIELTDLDTLLDTNRIVTVHCPLTPFTSGLIDDAALERLGAGYLINTSRGEVVDHDALYRAAEGGELRGAALDVFDPEPPQSDHPLLGLPHVLVTPHVGGWTDGYLERSARFNAAKITTALDGGRPDGLLNPHVLE